MRDLMSKEVARRRQWKREKENKCKRTKTHRTKCISFPTHYLRVSSLYYKTTVYVRVRTRVLIQCHEQQSCLIHWGTLGKSENSLKTHSTILFIPILFSQGVWVNIKVKALQMNLSSIWYKWADDQHTFIQKKKSSPWPVYQQCVKITIIPSILRSCFRLPYHHMVGHHTHITNLPLFWMALLYFQILNPSSNKDLLSHRILKSMSLDIGKQFQKETWCKTIKFK